MQHHNMVMQTTSITHNKCQTNDMPVQKIQNLYHSPMSHTQHQDQLNCSLSSESTLLSWKLNTTTTKPNPATSTIYK